MVDTDTLPAKIPDKWKMEEYSGLHLNQLSLTTHIHDSCACVCQCAVKMLLYVIRCIYIYDNFSPITLFLFDHVVDFEAMFWLQHEHQILILLYLPRACTVNLSFQMHLHSICRVTYYLLHSRIIWLHTHFTEFSMHCYNIYPFGHSLFAMCKSELQKWQHINYWVKSSIYSSLIWINRLTLWRFTQEMCLVENSTWGSFRPGSNN